MQGLVQLTAVSLIIPFRSAARTGLKEAKEGPSILAAASNTRKARFMQQVGNLIESANAGWAAVAADHRTAAGMGHGNSRSREGP